GLVDSPACLFGCLQRHRGVKCGAPNAAALLRVSAERTRASRRTGGLRVGPTAGTVAAAAARARALLICCGDRRRMHAGRSGHVLVFLPRTLVCCVARHAAAVLAPRTRRSPQPPPRRKRRGPRHAPPVRRAASPRAPSPAPSRGGGGTWLLNRRSGLLVRAPDCRLHRPPHAWPALPPTAAPELIAAIAVFFPPHLSSHTHTTDVHAMRL
ncbi:uncharacterized protein Tco025E_09870, partial [Trypanosoma conorhini]